MNGRRAQALALGLLAVAVTAGLVLAAEPDPAVLAYKLPNDFKWVDSKEFPGLSSAVLYGDPSKPGPYVVRNRFSAGSFSRPHFHPSDRLVVVVSGTWWVGTGEKFDPESTMPMPVGAFVLHHAGKVHYDGARGEACEVVISGIGPVTTTRVDAK